MSRLGLRYFRAILNFFRKVPKITRSPHNDQNLNLLPPKPFKKYSELVILLKQKGMEITDESRAERKLLQIGYYRLSGYWYPCRILCSHSENQITNNITKLPKRSDNFYPNIKFNQIVNLYLFDKQLRLLILDAIERIEIHIRSIIAHELGRLDPIAYKNPAFVKASCKKDYLRGNEQKNNWLDWCKENDKKINRSKDTFIIWNKKVYGDIPFWVIIETWDFGLMSNYYNILGDKYKDIICSRVRVPNKKTLNNWLKEINTLRNKCAHHSRVWNFRLNTPLSLKSLKDDDFFRNLGIQKDYERKRMYGCICVLWFLVKKIGPSSTWIEKVADLIDTLPTSDGIKYRAMGFPNEEGFPRDKFGLTSIASPEHVGISPGKEMGKKTAETKETQSQ